MSAAAPQARAPLLGRSSNTASVGAPPQSYQIQLRVERAKRLLLAGGSVSDAAHTAGFFDLSHFTRHFRRHVGVPPGVYARRAA